MPIGPVITYAGPKPAEPCVPQPPMQRVHRRTTPLSESELESARANEAERMKWDTYYITAAQARAIPQEAITPEISARIKYSQRDWPENRMSMSHALGPLAPGTGETYQGNRAIPASEAFWSPPADAVPFEHTLRGSREVVRPTPEQR